MPVTLYGAALSPPCRAVIILAEAIGLPLEIKKIDLRKQENFSPEYIKINPLHTIPTLDDNGTIVVDSHAILTYLVSKYGKDETFYPKDLINPLHTIPTLDDNGTIVVDSHAILTYLVSKYGKDETFYPKDLVKRALVDARLHFDTGYAFSILRRAFRAHVYDGQTEPLTPKQVQEIEDVYGFLNTFLEGQKWLAGDSVTVADISLISTVTSLDTMIPIDNSKYPNVLRWLNEAEMLPYYKVNKTGVDEYCESWKAVIKQ